jgi:excisionase family DNA binding protein
VQPEPNHDVRGVAATLGVSVQTVYMLCAKRRLRHVRVGVGRGTIRVPESAVREYLVGATVRPDEPTAPTVVGTKRVNSRYLRPPA